MEPCGFEFWQEQPAIYTVLIFHLDALNHALLTSARVVNAHFLARPQRGGDNFARTINDARSGAECEAHRAFFTPNHDRFSRLVGGHRPSGIGCGGFSSRCRSQSCRLLRCCCARLRKRQWGGQRTSNTQEDSSHLFPFLSGFHRSTGSLRKIFDVNGKNSAMPLWVDFANLHPGRCRTTTRLLGWITCLSIL